MQNEMCALHAALAAAIDHFDDGLPEEALGFALLADPHCIGPTPEADESCLVLNE